LASRETASKSDALLFGLGICAAPVSIAVAESLLAGSLLFRVIALARRREKLCLPLVFWFWWAWAALEVAVWFQSPDIRAGQGEMRHLLLIGVLFLLVPTLDRVADRMTVWRGVILTATVSSIFLIGHFVWQLLFYKGHLDPVISLRSGGLLHHWMLYGAIEILVFACLLELWHFYPEDHAWLLPVLGVNATAILLSLTRMLWIGCLLLLVLHLAWRRSKWVLAVPVIPCVLFFVAPGAVRSRVTDSAQPSYYSNAERLQMFRVGWEMIREKPITGVGPGRVGALYTTYLSAADPVPAFHGHLHNNLVQLAAEFGLAVAIAAAVFVIALFYNLRQRYQHATGRDEQCLYRTSILGLTGFLVAGMFDYTYGHSVVLILLAFAVLSPLVSSSGSENEPAHA
jgi:O-antigen ligase